VLSDNQYWPDENFWGWDRLTYIAHDGQSDSEPAMISIHVRNVNDLPIALWDIIEVHADSSVIGQLNASDVDYQDTLTFKLLESTTKGQLQLNETTGMFSYWAYETASGLDYIKFLVNDGTVNSNIAGITIVIQSEPPNIAPVAQDSKQITYKNQELHGRLNAVDANKDQLMFMISKFPANGIFVMSNANTGAFIYYPNENFTGTDSVEFYVNDSETDSNVAKLTITISESTQDQTPYYELSVLVIGPSQYSYSLMDNQGKVVVEHTFQYSDMIIERLKQGDYRLIILAKDYRPFEYNDDSPYIHLNQDLSMEVNLEPAAVLIHSRHQWMYLIRIMQQALIFRSFKPMPKVLS